MKDHIRNNGRVAPVTSMAHSEAVKPLSCASPFGPPVATTKQPTTHASDIKAPTNRLSRPLGARYDGAPPADPPLLRANKPVDPVTSEDIGDVQFKMSVAIKDGCPG